MESQQSSLLKAESLLRQERSGNVFSKDGFMVVTHLLRSSDKNQAAHGLCPCATAKIFLQFTGSVRIIFLSFCSPVIPVARLGERNIVFLYEFTFWMTPTFFLVIHTRNEMKGKQF